MKVIPPISDAEWEIMKVIWKDGPCTAQPVVDHLATTRKWQATTTRTVINRLVQKGVLNYKRDGRAYVYSSTVTQNECRRKETDHFLQRVFDGALSPFLAQLSEQGRKLRHEDIAELERILKKSTSK